jgi:coatomer protein complex subunit epsilon
VAALAELKAGNESKALKMAEKLAEEKPENGSVQVLCGTVLQAAGKSEEALVLLSQHQGNRMSCCGMGYIAPANTWLQLKLLRLLCRFIWSRIVWTWLSRKLRLLEGGLRTACLSILQSPGLASEWYVFRNNTTGRFTDGIQGGEKYQQAFYVFEELAQAPSTSSTQSLVSQAVAEIHLGRLEEAEAALQQALVKEPQNADIIANMIVLNVIAGKDADELTRYAS